MTQRALIACDRCTRTIAQEPDETRRELFQRVDDAGWIAIRAQASWTNVCDTCISDRREATA